jgi:AbrB family looped-hinge helix DNA binding protein
MAKTNVSTKGNQFVAWVTVSSKGQIAIPTEVRKRLGIKNGDRFLVVLRRNGDGFNLIKSDALGEVFERFAR